MRKRKEIEHAVIEASKTERIDRRNAVLHLILEVLLDIRGLLKENDDPKLIQKPKLTKCKIIREDTKLVSHAEEEDFRNLPPKLPIDKFVKEGLALKTSKSKECL